MIEKTPRARRMSKKELRARIDRVIAEEERTYGRLLELRDQLDAVIGELESSSSRPDCRVAKHLKYCCPAITVSPEQAMITPLRSAVCSPVTRPGGSPPILRSSLRRCPTMPTPRSCKSSAVRLGRTGCRRLIPAERRLILTKAQASEPRSDLMVAPLLVMAHDCPGRTAFQANSWPDNSRSGSVMWEWRVLPLASSPTKHGRARKTHQRPPLSQGGACAKRL